MWKIVACRKRLAFTLRGYILATILVYFSGWVIFITVSSGLHTGKQCLQGMPSFNKVTFQGQIEGIVEFADHRLGFPEDFERRRIRLDLSRASQLFPCHSPLKK